MRNVNSHNATGRGETTRARLMQKIREYDFAIVETALFLDTHPNCHKALNYYHKIVAEKKKLVSEYESRFGPLTIYGNENQHKWDWINGPWPWEGEC